MCHWPEPLAYTKRVQRDMNTTVTRILLLWAGEVNKRPFRLAEVMLHIGTQPVTDTVEYDLAPHRAAY